MVKDDKIITNEVEFKEGNNKIKIVGNSAKIKFIKAKLKNISLEKLNIFDLPTDYDYEKELKKVMDNSEN